MGCALIPMRLIEDISVGMQQRVEILKMLYRDNEILILDEPTAVLTPQEIDELMEIMRALRAGGQVHPVHHAQAVNEIMAVADRCTVLRKGKLHGHGGHHGHHQGGAFPHDGGARRVSFKVEKRLPPTPGETVILRREGRHRSLAACTKTTPCQERLALKCARARSCAWRASRATGRRSSSPRSTGLEKVRSGQDHASAARTSAHALHPRAQRWPA